ncbi:helix-turn-helix domain-containing protein [Antarcticibacterium arcticum]|uniref:Helix-turn-helix domain-containing protein n=1 Tax=Antarcticibacterium arcticum TaxID=2585771 RepID=A0A5B8YK68_9FLAO|nr:helix-turn-helix domain-containing protein [Antarcticibacterium arcticum]QED38420.1 helix-turn-helix domain-containing protein [Antarcticibacterium arcticum]
MSILKHKREQANLTQEELSANSGISIRTIQRIEAGVDPKGHTLRSLAKALGVEERELLYKQEPSDKKEPSGITEVHKPLRNGIVKLINLSSLPLTVFPPANIVLPLLIMWGTRQFNPLTKQIVSVQIMWTIFSIIFFMLTAFIKNWFSLGNQVSLVVMILLVMINVFIILRNTAEIDRKGKLRYQLNFSII